MGQTALQVNLRSSAAIATNTPVIFNEIKYTAGNASYNTLTGELTLLSIGRYVINWWLALQSSPSNNGAAFALESSQGDLIEGNSPLKTDEVYGIGIIDVQTAPVTVSLKNIGTGAMYLSTVVPLQGTMVLLEDVLDAGTGATGATGPTGATGVTGSTGATAPVIYGNCNRLYSFQKIRQYQNELSNDTGYHLVGQARWYL